MSPYMTIFCDLNKISVAQCRSAFWKLRVGFCRSSVRSPIDVLLSSAYKYMHYPWNPLQSDTVLHISTLSQYFQHPSKVELLSYFSFGTPILLIIIHFPKTPLFAFSSSYFFDLYMLFSSLFNSVLLIV